MKTTKKTLAVLLAVILLVSVLPGGAGAVLYSGGGSGNCESAYLDLRGFTNSELRAVPMSYILSHLTTYGGDPFEVEGSIAGYARRYYYRTLEDGVWLPYDPVYSVDSDTYYYSYTYDDFVRAGAGSTVNLCNRGKTDSGTLRLLFGTFDQLDRDNQFVDVHITFSSESFEAEVYAEDMSPLEIADYDESYSTNMLTGARRPYYRLAITPSSKWKKGDPVWLHLRVTDDYADRGYTVKAYLGNYEDIEDIPAEATEITEELFGDAGYLLETTAYSTEITFVWNSGKTVEIQNAYIQCNEASVYLSSYASLYYEDAAGSWTYADWDYVYTDSGYKVVLEPGIPLDTDFQFSINYYDYSGSNNNSCVFKAVIGTFDSLEAAADAEDVTTKLFGRAYAREGLEWNFAKQGPCSVTVFDVYGNVLQETYMFEENTAVVEEELSKETYFRAYGAYDPENSAYLDTYYTDDDDDSYYPRYQTLFVLDDGEPVQASTLRPSFSSSEKANIYASYEGASAALQVSGQTIVPVTYGKAIHYSASAENGTDLGDYYLTFVTQGEGSCLFVNAATNSEHIDEETGLPERVVYLDAKHEYHHDILFANFGDETMTGLQATLSDDTTGVRLHDYWSLDGTLGELPPFTGEENDNYGKIRLLQEYDDAFSAISGKLTISADGVEPVTILLSGVAGEPRIVTDAMAGGAVKFVPYATLIQTNYIGDVTDAIKFSVTGGELPEGVILKPNGEVYGVPLETGTFTFTVQAAYREDESVCDQRTYVLIVAENTDENVENATDEGYELIDRIPDYIDPTDQLFHSEGELSEFIAVYLDGRELEPDKEYEVEEGSTKITLLGETLEGETEGSHTIAAEFREGGTEKGELKRAAQNFTLGPGDEEWTGDDDEDWSDDDELEEDEQKEDEKKEDDKKTQDTDSAPRDFVFSDVASSAWYYGDVKWAFDQYLMNGVSATEFAPNGVVDAATIVTVLARTIGVDLTQFADSTEVNLPQDQWYSAAANWALQAGLIDDSFERNKPFARGQMAVLLYKYFKYIGIDCSQPETPVEFADAGQMTPQENDAFQVLYKYGIFKGVGNNTMDVRSSTSRAQLAALMHRVKNFIDSKLGS